MSHAVRFGLGIAGHQIVATIAQTQLHPAVREQLCSILPNYTQYPSNWPATENKQPKQHCHLAVLAGWPDTIRYRYPWSGQLHYVNPVDDHPPSQCFYGETGWTSPDNVLTSLVNYTSRVVAERDGNKTSHCASWFISLAMPTSLFISQGEPGEATTSGCFSKEGKRDYTPSGTHF